MPLRVDPTTAGTRWANSGAQAVQKYTDGINAVKVAPGQKAAAAVDLWANNVMASKARFARNVAAVSLQSWQADAVGASARLADGFSRKQSKYITAVTPVFQHMAGVLNQVDAMPRGSFAQNVARMNTYVQGMHTYKTQG